jgi:hypothetical protein
VFESLNVSDANIRTFKQRSLKRSNAKLQTFKPFSNSEASNIQTFSNSEASNTQTFFNRNEQILFYRTIDPVWRMRYPRRAQRCVYRFCHNKA